MVFSVARRYPKTLADSLVHRHSDYQGYGLTETRPSSLQLSAKPQRQSGRPIPNVLIPHRNDGEILPRSVRHAGYYKVKTPPAKHRREGWFHTGVSAISTPTTTLLSPTQERSDQRPREGNSSLRSPSRTR